MPESQSSLKLKRLNINTYNEPVVYLNANNPICCAEGLEARARVKISVKNSFIIATLNTVDEALLTTSEVSLSEYAWKLLGVTEGDTIVISHPRPPNSLTYIRRKIYGHALSANMLHEIIQDTVCGKLSDIHLAAFVTACAGDKLNEEEILMLSEAMVSSGTRMSWDSQIIVDKHCIGGLPGNRTTLIVVPIVSAFGLIIPKTSSRAITSPAGTADTMEVFAPVTLSTAAMRNVVEQEGGCIVWGGAISISPADDILIRIERALNIDSEGQMVASILSKKVSAGATHVVIDLPMGATAKIRDIATAELLKKYIITIGSKLGLKIDVIISNGEVPVGYGIGPALEAQDILLVLQNSKDAPKDLTERSLTIAGRILEFSNHVPNGGGIEAARVILESGMAWKKFQAIAHAQGGLFEPPTAKFVHPIIATKNGNIDAINNRSLARIAKLAGAPYKKVAGIKLHSKVGTVINRGEPLFTIHADTKDELQYAISAALELPDIYSIREQ